MNDEMKTIKAITIQADAKAFKANASALAPDRDRELLPPKAFAWSKKFFMANPVIDLGHSAAWSTTGTAAIPVGRVTEIDFTDQDMPFEGEWNAATPEGAATAASYAAGMMKAFSIFFIPVEWREPSKKELDQFGPDSIQRVLKSGELLSVSAVAVPSNRGALMRAHLRELPEFLALKTELDDLKSQIAAFRGDPRDAESVKMISAIERLRSEIRGLTPGKV